MSREKHIAGVVAAAEMIRSEVFPHLDKEEVYTAAFYHDCTKNEDQMHLLKEYGIEPADELLRSPAVIHAFTGAERLKKEGKSENIVNAVRYHTTGRPNMTEIEKIIFIADYIEENREYESCKNARNEYLKNEKTVKSIDNLILKILKDTIEHLKEKGAYVYPLTIEAAEYYNEE
ncbi:MAG: bis(5'-nucleosyl)-tetraphosphatase (symmetrical) YqeK [Clostridia bacterium]|nr:bis(5'-nucleosyl)-tetraphosphatase (symmetrical) YqeK [Clostridia bacterium]